MEVWFTAHNARGWVGNLYKNPKPPFLYLKPSKSSKILNIYAFATGCIVGSVNKK
jgi:hypothetical protein